MSNQLFTWVSNLFSLSIHIFSEQLQEGLAVASIVRDDPSTLPGDDPSPLPGMNRDHNAQ